MKNLLEIRHLTKRYGELTAVDDVSLDICPGEIFALLGPNGAGKTTLIGCVTGLTADFEGEVRAAGHDVVEDYRITRRLIGLVPQELNYDAFFSVRDTIAFQAGYFGVRIDERQIRELLRQFALEDKIEATSRWLSGGMKRRLMICKALVHDPVLLFLDEPTAGVDVELRDELWRYVKRLRDRGTTIVLTTHYLEEAEELADRIGIIHRGKILRVDSRARLIEEFGFQNVRIHVGGGIPQHFARRFDFDVELEESTIFLSFQEQQTAQGSSPVDQVLRAVFDAGLTVEGIEARPTSLEEIFRELVYEEKSS